MVVAHRGSVSEEADLGLALLTDTGETLSLARDSAFFDSDHDLGSSAASSGNLCLVERTPYCLFQRDRVEEHCLSDADRFRFGSFDREAVCADEATASWDHCQSQPDRSENICRNAAAGEVDHRLLGRCEVGYREYRYWEIRRVTLDTERAPVSYRLCRVSMQAWQGPLFDAGC